MKSYLGPIAVINILLATSFAFAHQPIISDGSAVDAARAIKLKDVQVSRVVYHKVTAKAPQLWLTFEVDSPQKLRLMLGVPLIERLREYRPTIIILGPGLPSLQAPFAIPAGTGGLMFDSRSLSPRVFHEPFTNTDSWILCDQNVFLPEKGRYYVVACDPRGQRGKLWIGLGQKEAFGLKDILMLPKIISRIRAFHESHATTQPTPVGPGAHTVFDFKDPPSPDDWVAVNDNVMGGVSQGIFSMDRGVLTFSGKISLENNGGFASIRSKPGRHDLSSHAGLLIRVRGDGQRYMVSLRTDLAFLAASYQSGFDTKKNAWQEVFLPFPDFIPRAFGRTLNDAPRLNPAEIRSFGFLIADKQAGPFKLEIDWIKAVPKP